MLAPVLAQRCRGCGGPNPAPDPGCTDATQDFTGEPLGPITLDLLTTGESWNLVDVVSSEIFDVGGTNVLGLTGGGAFGVGLAGVPFCAGCDALHFSYRTIGEGVEAVGPAAPTIGDPSTPGWLVNASAGAITVFLWDTVTVIANVVIVTPQPRTMDYVWDGDLLTILVDGVDEGTFDIGRSPTAGLYGFLTSAEGSGYSNVLAGCG